MPEVLKPAACGSLIKKPRYRTSLKLQSIPYKHKPYKKNNYFIHFSPREGTGIAKFKRGRWSASDESPPKKQKSSHTDSGTAHSKFHL